MASVGLPSRAHRSMWSAQQVGRVAATAGVEPATGTDRGRAPRRRGGPRPGWPRAAPCGAEEAAPSGGAPAVTRPRPGLWRWCCCRLRSVGCAAAAPRTERESPSRATSSFFTSCLPTTRWTRRRSAVSGTISSRVATTRPSPFASSDARPREGGAMFGCVPVRGGGLERDRDRGVERQQGLSHRSRRWCGLLQHPGHHHPGGDQGAAGGSPHRRHFGDSTPADARPRRLDRTRPPRTERAQTWPLLREVSRRTREGGRRGRRHARRKWSPPRPAPGPPRRRQAAGEEAGGRSRRALPLRRRAPAAPHRAQRRHHHRPGLSSITAGAPPERASAPHGAAREAIPMHRAVWERDHGASGRSTPGVAATRPTCGGSEPHRRWRATAGPPRPTSASSATRHNALAARRRFGEAWMGRCTRSGTIRPRSRAALGREWPTDHWRLDRVSPRPSVPSPRRGAGRSRPHLLRERPAHLHLPAKGRTVARAAERARAPADRSRGPRPRSSSATPS